MVKKTPESIAEGDTRPEPGEAKQCLRVDATVELPPGAEVQLTITYRADSSTPVKSQIVQLTGGSETTRKHLSFNLDDFPYIKKPVRIANWLTKISSRFSPLSFSPLWFMIGAVLVYYLVRLIRLTDFPIFFFTDEAIHTIQAMDLIRSGFSGSGGEILPTFFKNGSMYNLGTSVYLQVLPAMAGLHSVFVTRLVSTTTTLLAAIALGFSYNVVQNNRRGWIAVLVLSMIPAWFYHSRTAFETAEAVSFYAAFLYGYLQYRNGRFGWIYASVAAAALAFYCYSPARVVMAVIAACLLIADFRFHWENRKKLWLPLLVGLVFCVPYFRFLFLHPGENEHHLELLGSYWVKPGPVYEKVFEFLRVYLNGINPYYWFIPNQSDLSRHIMKGMGHLGWFFLPFFAGGLILGIKRWKNPGYRIMFLALLTAPAGAAVAGIGITRALFMVIPAAFFMALGFDFAMDWIWKRFSALRQIDVLVFFLLTVSNFILLDVSLTYGPTWFSDYGMGGMQYGGKQVFQRISEIHTLNPELHINLSPDWANGTDVLGRFHMGDPLPIEMAGMDAFINDLKPFPEGTLFVMAPDDLRKVVNSAKFDPMQVVDVIFYPDGTPGFVFAHLKYSELATRAFDQDRSSRKVMVPETIYINGILTKAASSRLDMGSIQQIFDNDPATLIRSEEANPLVVEVIPEKSIPIHSITALVGGGATELKIYVQPEDGSAPFVSSIAVTENPRVRTVKLPVNLNQNVARLRIEVRTVRDSEPSHVHLWDVTLE